MAEFVLVDAWVYTLYKQFPIATASFLLQSTFTSCCGHILSHASTTRMSLRKGEGIFQTIHELFNDYRQKTGRAEERVAKLVDSPERPESEASYKLEEGGWADI